MRFDKHYFKEDEESKAISTDVKPSLEHGNIKDKLKEILNVKFSEIGKQIKELTRPASKGKRKGLLIFVPDAARKIYAIEDEFVKYVVRDTYDHYRDITRGVLWQVHMNWLFGSDFVMHIVKQLSSDVNRLQK